ncbi:nucleotide exchange factor GrpE [bacterium]|nr:nucleotide exchange factor GrpE [bacterium]
MRRNDLEELFPLEQRPLSLVSRSHESVLDHVYRPLENEEVSTQQRVRNARLYAAGSALENLVTQLLPVLDTLSLLLDQVDQLGVERNVYFDNWLRSLAACHKRLVRVLERMGLSAVESVGRPVDFSVHDVIKVHPRPGVSEPRIIQELEKGYRFRDRVIRDAKVVAEVPPEETSVTPADHEE